MSTILNVNHEIYKFFYYSTEEQKSNPEAVINSLKTYSRSIKQTPDERYLKVTMATLKNQSTEGAEFVWVSECIRKVQVVRLYV
jgi:hypothetical protein